MKNTKNTQNIPPNYFSMSYRNQRGEIIKNKFNVYENRTEGYSFCFTIDISKDLFNNILKRGIPYEQALNLFYSMTGNQYKPTI